MITVAFDGIVHDRTSFNCGNDSMNSFLRNTVSQWERKGLTRCWVLESEDSHQIVGYYTLSAIAVTTHDALRAGARQLPSEVSIPALLVGQLAVDIAYQGSGVGKLLLIDALKRTSTVDVAWALIVVDAIDERAATWYEGLGFVQLSSNPRRLALTRSVVAQLLL